MNWNQISLEQYIQLMKIVAALTSTEAKIGGCVAKLKVHIDRFEANPTALMKDKSFAQSMSDLNDKIDELQDEQEKNLTKCVLIVTSKTTKELVRESVYSLKEQKEQVQKLLQTKLPSTGISSFKLRGLTELQKTELSLSLKSTSSYLKRKRLKKAIENGLLKTYNVRNIWEQPTLANKMYHDLANMFSNNIKTGDWSVLPYLIAALTADEEITDKIKDLITGTKEELTKEFLLIAKDRAELFKKMPCTTAIQVLNFFLNSWKRLEQPTKAS